MNNEKKKNVYKKHHRVIYCIYLNRFFGFIMTVPNGVDVDDISFKEVMQITR